MRKDGSRRGKAIIVLVFVVFAALITLDFTQKLNRLSPYGYEKTELQKEIASADRIDMLAEQLFRELLLQNEPSCGIDERELRIRQAASWLTRHYMEPVDLNRFFIRFGFSRRNFYRYWEKVFAEPPKEYLRNLRLQEAERLLGFRSYSVADIAWQLQFRDVSHFIRIFRQKYGMTPLQFRRKYSSEKL